MDFHISYPVLTVPATRLRRAAAVLLVLAEADHVPGGAVERFAAEAGRALRGMLPHVSFEPCDVRFLEALRYRQAPDFPVGPELHDLVARYVQDWGST